MAPKVRNFFEITREINKESDNYEWERRRKERKLALKRNSRAGGKKL